MTKAAIVEEQLKEALGLERAGLIASIAVGAEATLERDPFWHAMLPRDIFPALAVLYGRALRVCRDGVVDQSPYATDEGRADAQRCLDVMQQIVTLVDVPMPKSPIAGMPNLDTILAGIMKAGVAPSPVNTEDGDEDGEQL